MTYSANTILYSNTVRYAVEVKRDNGDGTFATVFFERDGDGGLRYVCGEYVTPSKEIDRFLDK